VARTEMMGMCKKFGGETSWKTSTWKAKTDIGKYSFVNRTIQLWNQLPEDVLGTLSCKPSNFRERVMKVINKEK
jgi:hypothetical protein